MWSNEATLMLYESCCFFWAAFLMACRVTVLPLPLENTYN